MSAAPAPSAGRGAGAPTGRPGAILRWSGALLLLAGAFAADVFTGSEISSSLYYLVAIAYAAWFLGHLPGVATAALGALAWLTAYFLVGQRFSRTAVLVWNLSAEVAVYVAMALAVGFLRRHMGQVQALADRLTEANRLLDRETRGVGQLQRELLPEAPPPVPGYAWSVHYETSTRAGGDYYDFVTLPDGRIGVLIADASGHGAPAAVLMAMTRTLLRAAAAEAAAPADRLARLNRGLGELLPAGWFVTACYAVLDPQSGALDYALAGHEAPLLRRARDRSVERLALHGGPLLGPFPRATYESGRVELERGDALVLYTDGLPEAVNPDGRLLEAEAVLATLESVPDGRPETLRARLLERVAAHRAGAALSDDLTLLILSREA